MGEYEDMSVEDLAREIRRLLEAVDKARLELRSRPEAVKEIVDSLESEKAGLQEELSDLKSRVVTIETRIREIDAEIAFYMGRPKRVVRAAPVGGKRARAIELLLQKGEGETVTPKEIAVYAGYAGGAAGAFLKQMLTLGVVEQPGGRGSPYRIVDLSPLRK